MQVAQVKSGVDQQGLEDMARHMGMRVGYQGCCQVLFTGSLKKDTSNAVQLSLVSASDEKKS